MKKYRIGMMALPLLLAALSLSACGAIAATQAPPVAPSATQLATSAPQAQPNPLAQPSTSNQGEAALASQGTLEQIYAQVNPSVVNIHVTMQVSQNQSPLGFFFGQQPNQSQTQEALGSGFVLDTQGHIVTNNHVVEGATSIDVTFQDGTVVPATVVGTDPDSDLAVIKVDNVPASLLHPVQFDDSAKLKVGQLVIAIGNPYGLQGSMSVGIVSALGRALPTSTSAGLTGTYTIPDIIQTDAAINPGNSGGVLLDDAGHVVGVTSAIVSSTNSSAGIGFAIPSIIVQKVVPQLIAKGHYDHSRLGISGTSLNSELATAMKMDSSQRGALVVQVETGTPAEKAGLRGSTQNVTVGNQTAQVGGDVITAIDGQPITSFDDLSTYLARYTDVGQTIKLTVLRDGKSEDISVTLDARPAASSQTSSNSQTTPAAGAYLGVQGIDLSSAIIQAMGLPSGAQGVLIVQVVKGSPADQAGLQGGGSKTVTVNGQAVPIGGDIIIGVDRQPVDSIATLQSILQGYQPNDQVTLTVVRNNQEIQVQVTLGEQTSQQ